MNSSVNLVRQIPLEFFAMQRQFCKATEVNRDFVWWAETLVTEETKELREAYESEQESMENVFKELADLIYVICGFYNHMPQVPHELLTEEHNVKISKIIDDASDLIVDVTHTLKIPLEFALFAFQVVHASNMTKIDPKTGKPQRRQDGKILKGKHYVAPNMASVVVRWREHRNNTDDAGIEING